VKDLALSFFFFSLQYQALGAKSFTQRRVPLSFFPGRADAVKVDEITCLGSISPFSPLSQGSGQSPKSQAAFGPFFFSPPQVIER